MLQVCTRVTEELHSFLSQSELSNFFVYIIDDDKSEFLVIGSRQQFLKIHHCSVRVGNIDIKPVKVLHNLGAWFDSHFSMSTYISKSCSAAFFWLHNIKRISHFLPRDKLEMVLHAFVTSKIDYCNDSHDSHVLSWRTDVYFLALYKFNFKKTLLLFTLALYIFKLHYKYNIHYD